MESLGYVLMYFMRGSLPWQGLKAATKRQKYERISEKKMSTPIEELCKNFPCMLVNYCENYSAVNRDHSFPWTTEFQTEPQNLPISAEHVSFRRILYWPAITFVLQFKFAELSEKNANLLKSTDYFSNQQNSTAARLLPLMRYSLVNDC